MRFDIKIAGHATLNDAVFFNPVLEGQSTQITIEFVGPLMVGTHKTALIAMGLLTKPHASVRTAVLHHPNPVVYAFL